MSYEIKRHNNRDGYYYMVYFSKKVARTGFFARLFLGGSYEIDGRYTYEFDDEDEAQAFIDREQEEGTEPKERFGPILLPN